jgi:hypothetical protein
MELKDDVEPSHLRLPTKNASRLQLAKLKF